MLKFDFNQDELKIINNEIDYNKLQDNELQSYIFIQKDLIAKLMNLAARDSLTELYNNISVKNLVEELLRISPDSVHYFLFIDIDNFKYINDNFGHMFGDSVLFDFAKQLTVICKDTDSIIGRIGGDEFVVMLKNSDDEQVKSVALKICNAFDEICSGNLCAAVSCSVGISKYPDDSVSYTVLKEYADKALYRSKRGGKNCYSMFNKEKDL